MQVQLERASKNFCLDFVPIRRILQNVGAALLEEKDQIDYFLRYQHKQMGQAHDA